MIAQSVADILNHLSGGKQNGPGWDESFGSGVEERRKAEAAEPPSMWRSIKDGARRLLGLPPSGGADAGGGAATGSSAGSLTKLIDEAAAKEGIDSRIMEGIRAGESGHGSNYDKKDDAIESSWGPFQLNRRRGLGVEFEKDTGLDVRNPSTIPAQAAWVGQGL